MKNFGISPLIEKYSEQFEKDPRSKVFAPLAEGYRQAGLIDRSMEILKTGIRHNPAYVQGYIILANCYYDLEEFQLSYSTLKPLVSDNRDNLRLQKLFANTCEKIGENKEALESYKYLLFLTPKDKEISSKVKLLEEQDENIILKESPVSLDKFNLEEIEVNPVEDKKSLDEWIKIDLKKQEDKAEESLEGGWSQKPLDNIIPIKMPEAVDDNKSDIVFEQTEEKELSVENEEVHEPVITHSLVDLYINQGHITKAKELLEKILELNPKDPSSLSKMDEIRRIEAAARVEIEDEEDGHKRLLDSLDEKLGQEDSHGESVKIKKLQEFLDAIQKRSSSRNNSHI